MGEVVIGVLFSIMPVTGMKIKPQSRTIQGRKVMNLVRRCHT